MWVDTHCHLDAAEFGTTQVARLAVRHRAAMADVGVCVYPAVQRDAFRVVRDLAHTTGDAYALGVHPLYVPQAAPEDLLELQAQLEQQAADPRLVAVGEIGLDFFVPALRTPTVRALQVDYYIRQLQLAQAHGLPVILHVRQSVDALLAGLRRVRFRQGGIAHAFNGSLQQARTFLDLGFKLGFGGAVTFERALHLRRLVAELPRDALVLETDAPDMPPQWLYVAADRRAHGEPQAVNEPAELPRIAAVVAQLRGQEVAELMAASTHNAMQALPRLRAMQYEGVKAHETPV